MKLTEIFGFNQSFEKEAEAIASKCKPYLGLVKDNLAKRLLFRGITKSDDIQYEKLFLKRVRKDRKPRDTANDIHELINKYFERKFKIPFRSTSLFVTADPQYAAGYSNTGFVAIIFPIGKFHYCYSPMVSDLTVKYLSKGRILKKEGKIPSDVVFSANTEMISGKLLNPIDEKYNTLIMDSLGYKMDTDFNGIFTQEFDPEVMIDCNEYYGIAFANNHIGRSHFDSFIKTLQSKIL